MAFRCIPTTLKKEEKNFGFFSTSEDTGMYNTAQLTSSDLSKV